MTRPGPHWSARDARQIPVPTGYGVTFASGDPLAEAPAIHRGEVMVGLMGLFRRLDMGDAAAGRCLIAVVARALALWPDSATARARGPERVDRELAFVALAHLVDEVHLAPGEQDLTGRRRALILPRERLLAHFADSLRRLIRWARRTEAGEISEVEGPSLETVTARERPEAAVVEALDQRDQRGALVGRLAALNRTWLGDRAYSDELLAQLLTEAGQGSTPERAERIARWLDPARLHIKTACYILRVAGEVPIAESHRLLFSAGFRAREGNPFSRNSVSACASMAKRALRET